MCQAKVGRVGGSALDTRVVGLCLKCGVPTRHPLGHYSRQSYFLLHLERAPIACNVYSNRLGRHCLLVRPPLCARLVVSTFPSAVPLGGVVQAHLLRERLHFRHPGGSAVLHHDGEMQPVSRMRRDVASVRSDTSPTRPFCQRASAIIRRAHATGCFLHLTFRARMARTHALHRLVDSLCRAANLTCSFASFYQSLRILRFSNFFLCSPVLTPLLASLPLRMHTSLRARWFTTF